MGKRRSARAVLVGAAILALAGCTGVPKGAAPEVPGEGTGSTATSATASGAAPASPGQPGQPGQQSPAQQSPGRQNPGQQSPGWQASGHQGASSGTGGGVASGWLVKTDSIPFPVAVGNTWVYRTTAGGATGRTTDTIVAAGPGQAGYLVTMSSVTDVGGTATVLRPVYVFYPDGTIGYPVPPVNGVSVAGAVRWPDVAGLASGQAYRSVLHLPAGPDENVTVQGAGTVPVSVPAGTYQASVVHMTIGTGAGTVEVTTWIAQGVGPVRTTVLIRAAGSTDVLTTSELLSFTKAINVIGDGS